MPIRAGTAKEQGLRSLNRKSSLSSRHLLIYLTVCICVRVHVCSCAMHPQRSSCLLPRLIFFSHVSHWPHSSPKLAAVSPRDAPVLTFLILGLSSFHMGAGDMKPGKCSTDWSISPAPKDGSGGSNWIKQKPYWIFFLPSHKAQITWSLMYSAEWVSSSTLHVLKITHSL